MKLLCIGLLAGASLYAEIDGRVINRTTGQPQQGVAVTVTRLGEGMQQVGTVTTDAQGHFSFAYTPQGPHLIQSNFQGVSYNKMLPPGATPTGLQVEVFNASKQPADAKVAQHMILLQPTGKELQVDESIIYQNSGNTTFQDQENGTVKFYVPPSVAGDVKVSVVAPQGMPINRPAEKTRTPNVYTVKYPVKPGETQFNLSYVLPGGDPSKFSTRIVEEGSSAKLVTPKGVEVAGDGVAFLSKEPRTQASVYDIKNASINIEVKGIGSLRGPEPEEEQQQGPQIRQIKPRLYESIYYLLAAGLSIMAVAFLLLYRAEPAAAGKGKRSA